MKVQREAAQEIVAREMEEGRAAASQEEEGANLILKPSGSGKITPHQTTVVSVAPPSLDP